MTLLSVVALLAIGFALFWCLVALWVLLEYPSPLRSRRAPNPSNLQGMSADALDIIARYPDG